MKIHTILVADRNHHVRDFQKRELSREGYRVQLSRNAHEVLTWVYGPFPIDLLIIDPDLPGTDEMEILKKLAARIPPLPMIVHTFAPDSFLLQEMPGTVVFVKKAGKSIETLKKVAGEILQKAHASVTTSSTILSAREKCAMSSHAASSVDKTG